MEMEMVYFSQIKWDSFLSGDDNSLKKISGEVALLRFGAPGAPK